MELDWDNIDIPWLEYEGFADLILDKIGILDILDKWELDYTATAGGEFAYKMRCPFPFHADGAERTPSCYISQDQDSFYCFGCNHGGNTIDFVKYYLEMPYFRALEWAAALAGITEENLEGDLSSIRKRTRRNPEETVIFHVFKSGTLVRDWLKKMKGKKKYNEYCWWAEKQFVKMDELLNKDDSQWEIAKEYYDKMYARLKKYMQ